MQTRRLIPELMDDPDLDPAAHEQALVGLKRINAWTRNGALVWRHLSQFDAQGNQPLRVLDVATGSADIPIALMQIAARSGFDLEVHACDLSERAIRVAAENCAEAKVEVQLFRHDILQDPIPDQFDIVMCSQFMHHLSHEQVELVLEKMKSAATRQVLVVDLERGRLNWLQVWLATRFLSRSKVVHFDGPQSVRAAFTVAEFGELVEDAGFSSYQIRRKWPCRFVFVGETDGGS